MELQIPHRIRAEVSTQGVLLRKKSSSRKNSATAMRMERRKSNCGRSVPRPYPSIRRDTAKDCSIKLYGVAQGKEQHNAIRAIRRTQIQIPEPRILVARILRRHGRKEREPNCGVRQEPAKRGRIRGTIKNPVG